MQHYLAPLLKPTSVALVGASDKAGSLGRTVYENILAGDFKGAVYAVNPNRRRWRRSLGPSDSISFPSRPSNTGKVDSMRELLRSGPSDASVQASS